MRDFPALQRSPVYVLAAAAAVCGAPAYLALDDLRLLAPELRDGPWPLELLAGLLALAAAIAAARPRRLPLRIAAAALAIAATVAFSRYARVDHHRLPAPALSVDRPAPSLVLQDEEGHPWSLDTLRGRPAVVLVVRGVT